MTDYKPIDWRQCIGCEGLLTVDKCGDCDNNVYVNEDKEVKPDNHILHRDKVNLVGLEMGGSLPDQVYIESGEHIEWKLRIIGGLLIVSVFLWWLIVGGYLT